MTAASAQVQPRDHAAVNDLAQGVRRGAVWSVANTFTFRILNLAILAVVARLLSPHDFGVFAVALTVHAIVSSFAELGVSACLIRADIDHDAIAPTVATIAILTSGLLAASMFVFATPLATALGSTDGAAPLRVMSLAVAMVGLFAVPGAELARDFRQDLQFFAALGSAIPANVLLIVLAMNGDGAMAFAWSRVVGQAVMGLTITVLARKVHRPGFVRAHARFVLGFGLPLAGANLLNFILLNADYAFVGHLLGATRLGLYMLAFNAASWSTSLMSALVNGVAMPAFSRVKHDAARLNRALSLATRGLAIIALPMCALTLVLANPLVRVLYGARYAAAGRVLTVLAVYGSISVYCLLLANVLSGLGLTRALLYVQIAWLAVLVPSMAAGVSMGGLLGAGWVHVAVVVVVALPVYLVMLTRSAAVRLAPLLHDLVAPLLAAVAAGGATFLASHWLPGDLLRLIIGGLAGAVTYAALIPPVALPLLHSAAALPAPLRRPLERQADRLTVLAARLHRRGARCDATV